MSNKTVASNNGVGFFSLLFFLFVGLKLGGVISWSWWWVTAPLWGGFALVAAALLILLCGLMLVDVVKFTARKIKSKFAA